MTYLQYHLIFNLPLLIILGILNWNQPLYAGEWQTAGLVLLAVFIFTTPWDNIAAKWGIWGFPEGKYLFKIGYLPIEEYSFFLFQSIVIILLERLLFQWIPDWRLRFETEVNVSQYYLLGLSLPCLDSGRFLPKMGPQKCRLKDELYEPPRLVFAGYLCAMGAGSASVHRLHQAAYHPNRRRWDLLLPHRYYRDLGRHLVYRFKTKHRV